jgi:hypothetical protein
MFVVNALLALFLVIGVANTALSATVDISTHVDPICETPKAQVQKSLTLNNPLIKVQAITPALIDLVLFNITRLGFDKHIDANEILVYKNPDTPQFLMVFIKDGCVLKGSVVRAETIVQLLSSSKGI